MTLFLCCLSIQALSNIPHDVRQCRKQKETVCSCLKELKLSEPDYTSFCNFYIYNSECDSLSKEENIQLLKFILKDWDRIERFDYRNLYLLHEISKHYTALNKIDSTRLYLNKILSTPFDNNPYSAYYYREAHVDLAQLDYRMGHFFDASNKLSDFINSNDSIYNSLDNTQKAYTQFYLGSYYVNIPYEKFELKGLNILDSLHIFLQSTDDIHPVDVHDISGYINFEKVRILANDQRYIEAITIMTNHYEDIKHKGNLEHLGHTTEELALLHLKNGNVEQANNWADKSKRFYSLNHFNGEYAPYSHLVKAKVLSAKGEYDFAIEILFSHINMASGLSESVENTLAKNLTQISDPICLVEYLYQLAFNYYQKFQKQTSNNDLANAITFIDHCHQLLSKLISTGNEWDTKYLIKDIQKDAYSLKKEIYYNQYGQDAILNLDLMKHIESTGIDTHFIKDMKYGNFTNQDDIINYSIIGDSLYAFILKNNKIEKTIALGNYQTAKTLVVKFLNSIYNKEDIEQTRKKLVSILVSPLAIEAHTITLITERELALLPFDILFNYDVNKHPITINQQFSAYHNSSLPKNKTMNSIGLFNYADYANDGCLSQQPIFSNLTALQYANQENINIASILNTEQKPLSNEEFHFSLKNNKITHFSGHTFVSDHHYDLHYLLLACESNEVYTMKDIRETEINNDMVVLSACNTGAGKLIENDGIISLGRELIYAGAKSVISTLWSVNDRSTSIIMTEFYKELLKGNRKDEALRKAKLSYLEQADPEYQHPYYWAGFIAVGDMSPLFFPKRKWYYGGITLFGLAFIFLFYRKKLSSSRLAA